MSTPTKILFVCTANQCRSPMAEYLFRFQFCGGGRFTCASAGVMAAPGISATRNAVKALAEMGIDMQMHRSRMLDEGLLRSSDMVVVMTGLHRSHVCTEFPFAAPRVRLLTSFDPRETSDADIEDPVGLSLDVYRHVRDRIASALWGLEAHFIGDNDA